MGTFGKRHLRVSALQTPLDPDDWLCRACSVGTALPSKSEHFSVQNTAEDCPPPRKCNAFFSLELPFSALLNDWPITRNKNIRSRWGFSGPDRHRRCYTLKELQASPSMPRQAQRVSLESHFKSTWSSMLRQKTGQVIDCLETAFHNMRFNTLLRPPQYLSIGQTHC